MLYWWKENKEMLQADVKVSDQMRKSYIIKNSFDVCDEAWQTMYFSDNNREC